MQNVKCLQTLVNVEFQVYFFLSYFKVWKITRKNTIHENSKQQPSYPTVHKTLHYVLR